MVVIYGLYHSAAGMLTNEYRQNVIANNLANAETVGFKQDRAVLAERQPAGSAGLRSGPSAPDLAGLSGGLWLGETFTDFAPGRLTQTGQATDAALDGPGFFVVEADGRTQYTRDGRFCVTDDGRLCAASDGAAVMGVGGAPLRVNRFGGDISIDEEGRVTQDGFQHGQLAVVDFADPGALRKTSAARFDAGAATPVPAAARVLDGTLEGSSVEPVQELVHMIEAARAYEINARMVSLQDQSVGRLISVIGR